MRKIKEKLDKPIDSEYIARLKKRIRIGDLYRVFDSRRLKDDRKGDNGAVIISGRVTGKYRHLVTLDCGTSITYAQITQKEKNRCRYIK